MAATYRLNALPRLGNRIVVRSTRAGKGVSPGWSLADVVAEAPRQPVFHPSPQ